MITEPSTAKPQMRGHKSDARPAAIAVKDDYPYT